MCGFAGFLSAQPGRLEGLEALATRMANAIAHRGPDDSGAWADLKSGIALGHRRLSIVDLSPAGHQPMASRSGRFVMAFNGEIYNHLELRAELERGDGLPRFARNDDSFRHREAAGRGDPLSSEQGSGLPRFARNDDSSRHREAEGRGDSLSNEQGSGLPRFARNDDSSRHREAAGRGDSLANEQESGLPRFASNDDSSRHRETAGRGDSLANEQGSGLPRFARNDDSFRHRDAEGRGDPLANEQESGLPRGPSLQGAERRGNRNDGAGVGAWRGHSDTETLLAGFERWGIEATLAKTVGMFAIALWDVQERTLHLVRDRFGEKPLYYGWAGSGVGRAFVFGSELKALRAFPGFANPVCRQALAQYMRFMVVPAPLSIYEGIYKLEPGCLLTVVAGDGLPRFARNDEAEISIKRWWSLADVVQAGAQSQVTNEVEAVQLLEQRLADAVRLQSLADVPLGAFLSGGVDSSAIVALMQQQSMRPVKTFTVGFEEAGFDESPHARAVAQHLGTDHTELFVTAAEAQAVIAQLPTMYDEPFADSSQIPTHLVCRAARQQVTVALSGDAGDELFGGYNRYFWGPRIWAKLAWMPYPVRQALGAAISAMPVAGWDALSRPLNAMLPGGKGVARAGDKAHKLAARLANVRNLDDLYLSLVTEWQDPASVVRGDSGNDGEGNGLPRCARNDEKEHRHCDCRVAPLLAMTARAAIHDFKFPENLDPVERMMYRDSMTYLPDDILCKVDRAAMATSLETRVPFLDHRVAELAWQLPMNMKIKGGQGKWALRQVLYKHVPRELIDRPKAGFGIPVGQWLRGPLRPWAESLLAEKRLQQEGYFYPAPIRQKWAEHLGGKRDHTASLWAVLMFQAWLSEQG